MIWELASQRYIHDLGALHASDIYTIWELCEAWIYARFESFARQGYIHDLGTCKPAIYT
jgi:hypothetical protein